MSRAEDVIGQLGRDDMRQVARAADEFIVQFRAEDQRPPAHALPKFLRVPDRHRRGSWPWA